MSLIEELLILSFFVGILGSISLTLIDHLLHSHHLSLLLNISLFHLLAADNYLLQIQPYNFTSSKPKTDSTSASTPSKTEAGKAVTPTAPSTKTEASDTGAGVLAPGTGQKEVPPTWYDVDVVKGTQYTVTGYSTKVDFPVDQVRCGRRGMLKCACAFFMSYHSSHSRFPLESCAY